jgi:hypothetical protein
VPCERKRLGWRLRYNRANTALERQLCVSFRAYQVGYPARLSCLLTRLLSASARDRACPDGKGVVSSCQRVDDFRRGSWDSSPERFHVLVDRFVAVSCASVRQERGEGVAARVDQCKPAVRRGRSLDKLSYCQLSWLRDGGRGGVRFLLAEQNPQNSKKPPHAGNSAYASSQYGCMQVGDGRTASSTSVGFAARHPRLAGRAVEI